MTRDKAYSVQLVELANRVTRWKERVESLAREAREEEALAHAALYDEVWGKLSRAAGAVREAADLMDPDQTEAEDFA